MEHIAIDLGGKESHICVRAADGSIVEELSWGTVRLGSYLKKRPPSRVIVETSAEAFRVADTAGEFGHDVRVVPAALVPSLGVGARGIKTDRRDARVLSEVSTRIELPSVHVPTPISRTWKAACAAREALITARTQLINSTRGWMRTQLLRLPKGSLCTFTKRVRKTALHDPDGLPQFVEHMLTVIDALSDELAQADKQLEQLAAEHPVCQRLMTIPGVGPVTSVRFVAALDSVERFAHAHAVQSYLGLVPGEDSSSTRKRRTGITKAGPAAVRRTLVQAAWSLRLSRPLDPLVLWTAEVEKRRGKNVAVVALARRLAGVMYAIWRDSTRYEPARLRPRGDS